MENKDIFEIYGGKKLFGNIKVPKAKNSILPIIAGSVLCSGIIKLKDCPYFSDIEKMLKILESFGSVITRENKDIIIDNRFLFERAVPSDLAGEIRSSIFLLGPLLGRFKMVVASYPGGCNIGARPIDLHLKGLRALNVNIEEKFGNLFCKSYMLKGNDIHLDYPSVGATENIMMCAVLAKGRTRIFNPAKEPEILDLQKFLNSMGAKVSGGGSDKIVIDGVDTLKGTEFSPIPDRIIAGTYLLAGAICGGDITVQNVEYEHIFSLLSKLEESGFEIIRKDDSIRLISLGRGKSFQKIETMPYPGFPTDLQSQALVLQTVSKGVCVVQENLFETRYKIVPELLKMGANIKVKGNIAIVEGIDRLQGADVVASDLRAGAGLVLAGLVANGKTIVRNVEYIDRGYDRIEEAFTSLGANIKRRKF